MTALSKQTIWVIRNRPPALVIQTSSCLELLRLSNVPTHPRHTSSSALRSALHNRPLSASMYSRNCSFTDEYLAASESLCYLSRFSTPWLTVTFHYFRFASSFSTSYAKNVDITRSNVVCNGSTKHYAGHPSAFSASVGIFEEYANSSITWYPRWSNSVLFTAKYVFQIRCLLCTPGTAASFDFWALGSSDQNLERVATMQRLLPTYITSDAVENIIEH